jgi:hypothetical protein
MKRTLTAALAAAGLLAGGVTMASPASADSKYVPWDTNFIVLVNTSNFEWSPQLQYMFGVEVPQFTQCPGGWGPNQNTGDNSEQICRFQLKTSADYRDVTIRILPGSVITDPKTGNTITLNDVGNGIAFPATPSCSPPDPQTGETFQCILVFQAVDPSTVPRELFANIGYVISMASGAPEANLLLTGWGFKSSSQPALDAPVGSAVDVNTESAAGLGDDADSDGTSSDDTSTDDADSDDTSSDDTSTDDADSDDTSSDDTSTDDADSDDTSSETTDSDGDDSDSGTVVPNDLDAPVLRSKNLSNTHQVAKKHHTRVEKMANKVHNRGGFLTIHAYGPDEDLALARARAVRKHLEAHLAKRGHTESSPIWVTYAGDPDHKENTHVTIHWHSDTTLPDALPGAAQDAIGDIE